MNSKTTRIILIVLIIGSFLMITFLFIFINHQFRQYQRFDLAELELMSKEQILNEIATKQERRVPTYIFIPLFSFLGIGVGALVYYLMHNDLEKKEESLKYNVDVILKLLSPEERKIVKKILEKNGEIAQYELVYSENLGKVKVHRILNKLESRGIIIKEHFGKVNKVKLVPEIYEVLRKENK
ncbi:MAG: hypothetical protein QXR30_04395 [Candidatus Woesearchaeota archaeon]